MTIFIENFEKDINKMTTDKRASHSLASFIELSFKKENKLK